MAGHNKFSKIKHLKARNDAQKSKVYTKLVRVITLEAKKAGGNLNSPGLANAIAKARGENMPNDTIERAIKKATDTSIQMESIVYEAYGPGGIAILIDVLTENRNKSAQEIKIILGKHDIALAAPGSASWAFHKEGTEWMPITTTTVSTEDAEKLTAIVGDLEVNDDVQDVITNAE